VNAVAPTGELEARRKARPGEGPPFAAEPAQPSRALPTLIPQRSQGPLLLP
jgi:hypothetical protein